MREVRLSAGAGLRRRGLRRHDDHARPAEGPVGRAHRPRRRRDDPRPQLSDPLVVRRRGARRVGRPEVALTGPSTRTPDADARLVVVRCGRRIDVNHHLVGKAGVVAGIVEDDVGSPVAVEIGDEYFASGVGDEGEILGGHESAIAAAQEDGRSAETISQDEVELTVVIDVSGGHAAAAPRSSVAGWKVPSP